MFLKSYPIIPIPIKIPPSVVQVAVAMRYAPMAMVTCKTKGKAMGTAAMRMERAVSKVPWRASRSETNPAKLST
jgi:hypothetical protein